MQDGILKGNTLRRQSPQRMKMKLQNDNSAKNTVRRLSPNSMMKIENFYPWRRMSPPTVMTNKDFQPIQKVYSIIEFSKVSHSREFLKTLVFYQIW